VQPQRHPKQATEIDHSQLVSGIHTGKLKVVISTFGEFDGDAFRKAYPRLKTRMGIIRLVALPFCFVAGLWLLKSMGDPGVAASPDSWKIALGGLLLPVFLDETAIRRYRNRKFRQRLLVDPAFFEKVFSTSLIQVRRR